MGFFSRTLTKARIKKTYQKVRNLAESEDYEAAREAVEPLLEHLSDQSAANTLLVLLEEQSFDYEASRELAALLVDSSSATPQMLAALGAIAERLVDIRYLNEAAPGHGVLADLVQRLDQQWRDHHGTEQENWVTLGLGTVARLAGRTYDDIAEAAIKQRVELAPDRWERHYDLGLFYKTRGMFDKGLEANRRALELLGDETDESVLWNLGICATGAGDGETALAAWKPLGIKVELGDSGLPEGGFPQCKVRLAQFPLAERGPERDAEGPGIEETIWIERLSPCHGIVRSAVFDDEVGVDFGDVVLFDGAPITHHRYDGRDVAVFPHLATLERRDYQIYRFTGTQEARGQLQALGNELSGDAWLYVHDEHFRIMCRQCWESPDTDHDHDTKPDDQTFVSGKLCAPPTMPAAAFLAELDQLMQASEHTRVFAPELAEAAGDPARAEVEKRRLAMIAESDDGSTTD